MGRLNLEYFLARRIATQTGGRKNNVMVRIATLSVAIGIAVMIISLSVIFGFKREIAAKLSGFGSHVQIVNLDGNVSYETVPISKNQPFLVANPQRAEFFGNTSLCRHDRHSARRTRDAGRRTEGSGQHVRLVVFPTKPRGGRTARRAKAASAPSDIAVSRSLAGLLEVSVGDPLEMLFIQDPPRRDLFRVAGIYDTQFSEIDHMMVLTDLRNVQRLNGWDSTQITGFEIATSDFGRLEPLRTTSTKSFSTT